MELKRGAGLDDEGSQGGTDRPATVGRLVGAPVTATRVSALTRSDVDDPAVSSTAAPTALPTSTLGIRADNATNGEEHELRGAQPQEQTCAVTPAEDVGHGVAALRGHWSAPSGPGCVKVQGGAGVARAWAARGRSPGVGCPAGSGGFHTAR